MNKDNKLPKIEGNDLKLLNEGYQIGQGDKGGSIVFLQLDDFTRRFLYPGMATIILKNTSYQSWAFPVETFFKVRRLVDSFGLDRKYYMAFSILFKETKQALKANRMRRGKPEKIDILRTRFAGMDTPKSITIKYTKKESYTLPTEFIATFWKAFVFDADHVATNEKINIELQLFKIFKSLPLAIKNAYQIIEELQAITGEYQGATKGIVKKIEKRVARQKRKR